MSRKALTPEQLSRLCKCAPIVMEILDKAEETFSETGYIQSAYLVTKLVEYIYRNVKIPAIFVPAEDCDTPEQSEAKEECTLTPQQKYADELFSALERCVKDCEIMAWHLELKPEEWDNRYPQQKALIEKIKSQEVQS